MVDIRRQLPGRPWSLQRATNKRRWERGGKWRLCSSSKTIVYWSRTANEKKRSNCPYFHPTQTPFAWTNNRQTKFPLLLTLFNVFEVKSGSAYYLFYLASKGNQDGCYSNRKEQHARTWWRSTCTLSINVNALKVLLGCMLFVFFQTCTTVNNCKLTF